MDEDLLREKISETRHNEWESLAIGIIGLILVLVALFSVSRGNEFRDILTGIFLVLGLMIMFMGAFTGIYYSHQRSKLMRLLFAGRTTQLGDDTKEAIRDKIGYVCPNCGQRLPEGSKFCNNCGYKIK